jgi:hypothetical protein
MPGRKMYGYYRGESEVIARMESLRAAGWGFDRIAARLNDDDVPSRSRKSWSGVVINRILARAARPVGPVRVHSELSCLGVAQAS